MRDTEHPRESGQLLIPCGRAKAACRSSRVSTRRHSVLPPRLRGPDGKPRCRWCGDKLPKGRRSWCSDECVHDYKIRSSPDYARRFVKKRDHGICTECGLDCDAAKAEFLRRAYDQKQSLWKMGFEGRLQITRLMKLPDRFARVYDVTWWNADHIVPVAEGGGECGLDNLRTLCLECHHNATKALHERLRRQRAVGASSTASTPISTPFGGSRSGLAGDGRSDV